MGQGELGVISLLRSWSARSQGYIWGMVDQAFSSATNFSLLIVAGRALGPGGLGVVVIGITAYLLVLGLQRSLLTTPLVASAAALSAERRTTEIRRGFVMELVVALIATLILLIAGLVVPGSPGRGFLIVTPWLFPALLQDFWRATLFQERRPRSAAANDATWAVVMAVTVPLAWWLHTDWAIVGCWGAGALGGALLGLAQMRVGYTAVRDVFGWWRTQLWPFGRWLGLDGVVYSITSSTTVFALNGLIGPQGLGGLRAAQSIFAPLTLIVPAVTLPGLPATARALDRSLRAAMRLGIRLTAVVTVLAVGYVGLMLVVGGRVMPYLFGRSFERYTHLTVPIGVWQVVTGLGAGLGIFLTARRQGRYLLAIHVTAALVSLAAISSLAWTAGVSGAAWGYAVGGATATALTVLLASRSYSLGLRDHSVQS